MQSQLMSGMMGVLCIQLIAAQSLADDKKIKVDLSTPAKLLEAQLNAIEAEDVAALRATMHASKQPYIRVADDFAVLFTTNHRFHRIVGKKFPGNLLWDWYSEKALQKQREALTKTTFEIADNKATIVIDGKQQTGPGQITLIKIGNEWKFNFDDQHPYERYPLNPREGGGDTAAMMYLLVRYSPALDAVAKDVENGKLTTLEDVKKSMEERMSPILKAVEDELLQLKEKEKPAE